jgi:hypothetical protein
MEKEEKLKKTMVDTIQQLQTGQTKNEGPSTSMERWNTTWPSMSNTTPLETPKPSHKLSYIGRKNISRYQ